VAAKRIAAALRHRESGGGGGIIAVERVVKARPDGYTLVSTPIFQITMAPFTHDVTFDPVRDFKPVAGVAASPFAITVGGSFPANTLAEFISYVKSRPAQLSFGSAGYGSLTHVSSAVFLKSAGLDMIHVPYRGVAPAFTDLLAGHIAMLSASPVEIKPYLDSARVKPLAVTSAERSRQLPDVPAIGETLKSPPVVTYNGLLAPGRTPDGVVDTIAREIARAARDKALLGRLEKVGVEPILGSPKNRVKCCKSPDRPKLPISSAFPSACTVFCNVVQHAGRDGYNGDDSSERNFSGSGHHGQDKRSETPAQPQGMRHPSARPASRRRRALSRRERS
jgi:tripartite-type tricarboxylate transporter receptor subunit TctC